MSERGRELGTTPAGGEITVRLVKSSGREVRYTALVLADDGTHVVVRAPWAGEATRDFGFVRFEDGDIFTEHYWRDRWYSVKEVRAPDGVLKGWYCDVTRPVRVTAGGLTSEDLDLDLWLSADRTAVVRLDEDEFLESGIRSRDPDAAERAWRALEELERSAHGDFEANLGL